MKHFHPLRIKQIIKETPEAVHISFDLPTEFIHYYSFKQGQYITLRHWMNREELRRSYSLVNAPGEKSETLDILVKQVEDGRMSTYLNTEAKVGDVLEVMPPDGHFYTHYNPANEKVYVGLAAGSGISPVLSNLKEALYQEPKSIVWLFFSNRSRQEIIFREQIDALAVQFPDRFKVRYLLSREKNFEDELFEGRITPQKLKEILAVHPEIPVQESTYFICGPTQMIKEVSAYLAKEQKVPSVQVMYEYFSAPDDEDSAEMSEEFKKIPNLESFVTLIIDDDEYNIHLNSKKESILDKALKDNLPVPFACKGGVCCTCKAQVMEGEVFMEKNFALTEEEVERGMVLTCQCHPTTNIVMLNYDV